MRRIPLLAVLLLCASAGFGQTGLATVTGTITDSAGAVVPNAPVELRNLETGVVFKAASSGAGNFTVGELPVGDYDLTISVSGFKKYFHAGFHLSAEQTMREDVALQVGQVSDAVTVTTDSSLLRTESSELVHNITLSELDNLPLLPIGSTNSGFRDPLAAVRLAPGVRYTSAALATTTVVINGTPANTYQMRLDGATQSPTSSRLLGATMQTQPSVDAIQEVAILTSNFAPEFGTAGGAMINMVTKSGSNQFHGSVYDYAVNEALNAHQPYTGLRNKIRQHDWGVTFGGPVWIPKVYNGKNKTFFFFSFEQYREKKIIRTASSTVPIDAYRQGDFTNLITQENRLVATAAGSYKDPLGRTIASGTIFDPASERTVGTSIVRDPFPNNIISPTRFDPVAVKILQLVPEPFGPNSANQAGSNYQAPYDQSRISEIPSIKVDQVLGPKMRMSVYLQSTSTSTPRTTTGADNLPDTITGSSIAANSGRSARVNFDYTATARLLVHWGVNWNDSDFLLRSPAYPYNAAQQLGLSGQTAARDFPIINTNVSSAALGGMSNLGATSDQRFFERRPLVNASGTYVHGRHTFKLGVEIRQEKFPNYDFGTSAGSYTTGASYTGQTSLQGTTVATGFTGFGFASFLLGGITAAQLNAPLAASTSKYETSLYAQDSWKASRKLTFDYGLRWDYGTYAREQYGRYSTFSPDVPNPSAGGRLGARKYEAVCHCNFANNYPYAIGPRLGLAYQIHRKTVMRAGIGVVYNATSTAAGGSVNAAFSTTPAFDENIGLLRTGMPPSVNAVWPTFDPAAGQSPGSVVAAIAALDPNSGRPARLLQWNITMQREINRDLAVEAGYVGNRGVWWEANSLVALNAISEPLLRSLGFNDFTSATDSALLTTTIANLTAAQKTILASRGVSLTPYSNFPATQTVRQALSPFPQYLGLMNPSGAPLGKNWYDSLQITVNKRFSRGLTANLNYNFSKTLELMSSPDVFNRQLGKNLGAFDLPQQLRLTAQYQTPRIKSNKPVLSNKIVSYFLSGWGTAWYLNYQSAPLVGLPASAGTLPISNFLGRGPGPAQLMAGPDDGFMNPWSVDWYDNSGKHHTDPLDINCHCFDPTKTVVLNPAVWQNVPNGQWAANQSSIRFFRGMRVPVENANVSREFRFKEGIRLNIRAEFTNIFNRLQYPGINLGNFANAPTKFTTGANAGLYSGGFGTIVPETGTSGQRAGTIVARLTF
ncbi:MAG TPA: carboxypeptidase-like regulatory domain-containing protein [Bryobacteraceae bacterium]|nr:carboxypeptidase-like regulatory domain-containing protein [Bryobacteraceae bacterium]